MWKRRGDFDVLSGRDSGSTKVLIVYCAVFCLLVLAAGLLVFFLYPRRPDVKEDGVVVNTFFLNDTYMDIDATVFVLVDNPNYAAIHLESVHLDVSHEDLKIGALNAKDKEFPSREAKREPLRVVFHSEDSAALISMNLEYRRQNKVTLHFQGPVKVTYLGVAVTEELDFTKEVTPTATR